MVCFVIALRSKAASSSWERVSRLCQSTLRSISRQADPDFHVIVVCHEKPEPGETLDERFEFIEVDFPPPAEARAPFTWADKKRKICRGLVRAAELRPDFVMIMDADDRVSRSLVGFANAHKGEPGWYLDSGYRYIPGRWRIELQKTGFHLLCGSSAMVRGDLMSLSPGVTELTMEEYEKRFSHHILVQSLAAGGTPLAPLPFPGVVYIVGTGENDSRMKEYGNWRWAMQIHGRRFYRHLRAMMMRRVVTRRVAEEFALVDGRLRIRTTPSP